ncbi:MAG: DUF2155 domain-containing protein [Alphaproteobacteria bacterium]
MSNPRPAGIVFAAVVAGAMVAGSASALATPQSLAVLQGLNKVTARVSKIEAPVDRTVRFGTLEITVRVCDKAPPEEPPESAAFLEIRDVKPGETPVELFVGWMFASSPGLSALEHPVYDIWVLDCQGEPASGVPAAPTAPPPPGPSSG